MSHIAIATKQITHTFNGLKLTKIYNFSNDCEYRKVSAEWFFYSNGFTYITYSFCSIQLNLYCMKRFKINSQIWDLQMVFLWIFLYPFYFFSILFILIFQIVSLYLISCFFIVFQLDFFKEIRGQRQFFFQIRPRIGTSLLKYMITRSS